MLRCDECGSKDIVATQSDIVCGQCGLCLCRRIVTTIPKLFDPFFKTTRPQPVEPIAIHGTTIGTHKERNGRFRRLEAYNNHRGYIEIKLNRIYWRNRQTCSALRLSYNQSILIWKLIKSEYDTAKGNSTLLIAACQLIFIRDHGLPISIKEIVRVHRQFGYGYMHGRSLNQYLFKNPQLLKKHSKSSSETYIPKAVDIAVRYLSSKNNGHGFDHDRERSRITCKAQQLLAKAKPSKSKNPLSVAAAAVYTACKILYGKKGPIQATWSHSGFTPEYTLRECWVKDFRPILQEANQ